MSQKVRAAPLRGWALITGAIGFCGAKGIQAFYDQARKETIEALKRPTPSLSHFTRKLTAPSR